jgi:deoxyguanosine kinase
MDYNYIVIEGNIGVGKTSLAKKISKQFNANLILERFADNPFLPKFYENPDRYSFPLELSFLAERYNQFKMELCHKDLFKTFSVADYYFVKSLIFAKTTLPDDEYNLYSQIYKIIYGTILKPDLFVYLHLTPEKLLNNIRIRGREYEQNISEEYLMKVQTGYFNYFKQQPGIRFLIIDTNNIDFINNQAHYQKIIEVIFEKNYDKGINRVIL